MENPLAQYQLEQISSETSQTFVLGDCNKLVSNVGWDLISRIDNYTFNPLFIHGGEGQGKTTIVKAIGYEIKEIYPNKIVLYILCKEFIKQSTKALKSVALADHEAYYDLIDVLIIDDIHFLAKKVKIMEFLLHVIDRRYKSKKVMIFTSYLHPSELKGIDDKLINRFKSGLVAELQAPDFETRMNILKHYMSVEGIRISDPTAEYIANHITSNVRELKEVMFSLITQRSPYQKEVNLDLAVQVVKNFVKNYSIENSIDYIQKVVSEYFGISVEKLKEKNLERQVVTARQISMYFAKKYTNLSLKDIGQHFGGRNNSTIIHAIATVNDLMHFDHQVNDMISKIEMQLVHPTKQQVGKSITELQDGMNKSFLGHEKNQITHSLNYRLPQRTPHLLFNRILSEIKNSIETDRTDFKPVDLYYEIGQDYIRLLFFIGQWDFNTQQELITIKRTFRREYESTHIAFDWVILPENDFHSDEDYSKWSKLSFNRDGK